MNKIYFLILAIIVISCGKKEDLTIQKFISQKHIDGEVIETIYLKDITPKDSVDYFHMEFLKLRTDDLYAPSVTNLEQAIEYCKLRIKHKSKISISNPKYRSDQVLFEVIKRNKDKYSSMEEKILGKIYETTIKIEGESFPRKMNISLSPNLDRVLRVNE